MQTTLKTIKTAKSTHRKNKILSVILVVFLLISASCASISAVTCNNWNLIVSQVDVSYFYIGGTSLNTGWDASKRSAWHASNDLAEKFNLYVVSTNIDSNLVKQLEYLYSHGQSSKAVEYGNRWNDIWYETTNLIEDTKQICSSSGPTYNRTAAQNLYSQIHSERNRLQQLAGEIMDDYQLCAHSLSTPDIGAHYSNGAMRLLNSLWKGLGDILKDIGTNSANTNSLLGMSWTSNEIGAIADSVSGITKTFAYAIACILFGVNVTSTSLQYELLTLRGGIKIFARVLLVKIWIDLAIPICMYSLNIINSLARQMLAMFNVSSGTIFRSTDLVHFDASTNNGILDMIIKAAEGIINFFGNLFLALPPIAILIVLIVCIISVLTKIIARAFELTALVTISPLFFATLVGEETKNYFKKFLSAFLSTAGYIVFISVVYIVASRWIQQCTSPTIVSNPSDLLLSVLNLLPKALIIIACTRIMKKPPKVLISLFDGG